MNGHPPSSEVQKEGKASNNSKRPAQRSHWFSLPPSIRYIFDSVPLLTIAENHPPQRSVKSRDQNVLYIFATSQDTVRSNLSCNPTCLKWQAYLISRGIDFTVKSSNNHASPSGSLPFLLPKCTSTAAHPQPVTANKLPKWCATQLDTEDFADGRLEIHQTLIDQNLRLAWLYHLYLNKSNFTAVATPLYVKSSSSNSLVQMIIASQLRAAAQNELTKTYSVIEADVIFDTANKSLKSLSTWLGKNQFFAGKTQPSLFDASLFAYTHLLCETKLGWADVTLQVILSQYPNLLDHRDRMLQICLKS